MSAFGRLFPGWAAKRATARVRTEVAGLQLSQLKLMASTYKAGGSDRGFGDFRPSTTSADSALIPDARTINARARALVRDDFAGASIVDGYARHVVGIGVTPSSNARDPETGKETPTFETFNRTIDRLFFQWAHDKTLCDIERRMTWNGLCRVVVNDLTTVGQAFGIRVLTKRRRGQVPLAIQMFETEQLNTMLTRNPDTGNEVRGGIEIDSVGAAAAYWVHLANHPVERWSPTSARIEAERVMHVMRPRRVRQTHGESRLVSVIRDIIMLMGYKEAEAFAKKIEACMGVQIRIDPNAAAVGGAGGVTQINPGVNKASGDATVDANGNVVVNMKPGMTPDVSGLGRYLEMLNPQRPGAQYEPYVSVQAKQIAAGAGWDYNTMVRDYTKGTYSGNRQGKLELDSECDSIQVDQIVDGWGRPIRQHYKTVAVLMGLVEAPGFFDEPEMTLAYLEDSWQGPPKPWVSPKDQAKATESRMDYGSSSLRNQANELGGRWQDWIDQRAEEQAYAAARGVKLPWMDGGGSGNGNGQADEADEDNQDRRDAEELAHVSA